MSDHNYSLPGSMYKIEPLTKDNWVGWKQHVWSLLEERDFDGYANSTIIRPTEAAKQVAWDKKDRAAMRGIKLCIGDKNMGHILSTKTSKQMWDHLVQIRERRGTQGILSAQRQLHRTVAEEGAEIGRAHV